MSDPTFKLYGKDYSLEDFELGELECFEEQLWRLIRRASPEATRQPGLISRVSSHGGSEGNAAKAGGRLGR